MATKQPSTPESAAFQESYEELVATVKSQPGSICDACFAKGYISTSVRDYIRTDAIPTESKAQKLIDAISDKIELNPSVFHGFIELLQSPSTDDVAKILKERCTAKTVKHNTQELLQNKEDKGSTTEASSGFECPFCTECTLETLLSEEGCPKRKDSANKKSAFPFLDIGSIDQGDKEDLEARLISETAGMVKRFADFTILVRESFEKQQVPLEKVKDSILSLDAFTEDIGVKTLDTEDVGKIEAARNFSEVFIVLRRYISFFNYQIIEHIIEHHGSANDNRLLREYLSELEAFCKRNVFEVPLNVFSSKPRKTAKVFALKCTDRVSTLEGVQGVKRKVAKILGLRPSVLQLCSINKGCIELHFLISKTVADHIFPVSPSLHSLLAEIGVQVQSCKEIIHFQTDEGGPQLVSQPCQLSQGTQSSPPAVISAALTSTIPVLHEMHKSPGSLLVQEHTDVLSSTSQPSSAAQQTEETNNFKTAVFKCTKCGHGWNSIRSLNLPEKCRQCGTKGCKPTVYRPATRPEQLQGKKTIMVAKYKCDVCGEKWKSINSSGTPKPCFKCKKSGIPNTVKPYKYRKAKPEELKPKRKFGFFECKGCKNEWPSAYTWVGKYQECKNCGNKVYPHAVQPLKRGSGARFQKPHHQSRCEKCKELGYNCRGYIAKEDDEEVEFEDGQSIISVASSTSTDVSEEPRDDVTPTVSDDEEQADKYLSKKVQNLRI